MDFNGVKCKVMHISKTENTETYTLDDRDHRPRHHRVKQHVLE